MLDLDHEAHGEEELWLISYADLVTILMGFFVIMYSMSTPDAAKVQQFGELISSTMGKADLGSSPLIASEDARKALKMEDAYRRMLRIAGLTGDPEAVIPQLKKIEKEESARHDMAERFDEIKLAEDIKSKSPDRSQFLGRKDPVSRFVLPERFLFTPGTNQLSDASKKSLLKLSRLFGSLNAVSIEIVGHTDSSPPNPNSAINSNWALSSARAGAVAEVFIEGGVKPAMISVQGVADTQIINPGILESDRAANRRVEIKIVQRY